MVSTKAESATITQIHVGLPLHYLSAGLTDRQAARFGHQHFSFWRRFFGTPVSRALMALGDLVWPCGCRRSPANLAVRARRLPASADIDAV